jgi:hypothetical protein
VRREARRRAAWGRLRDDAERDRALELARRYEAEVLPRLIRESGEREICAVESQFGGGRVEIPEVYNPVRLPPAYGVPRSAVSPAGP